ncbi:DMT family transporter [Cellulophaga tyrosinoxydans]|uniref:Threonine/homoserine efflux transporter RhtA n=1 Tax=Cellulophaga tyrosinoxydans TaxID=504486 RepID=A0A1W2BNB9_9FLAO|nr:DMT family transporter [Cellulophaga tyrosinoxydans]SMC74323.1 Threonine/homoserine efflux transporter RhtA [Cellulophaga tyrosinoxydans]
MLKNSSSTTIGVLFAILGIIFFSAKAVLVKLAYQYHVDYLTLLLFRMTFSVPFYIIIAFWKKPKAKNSIRVTDWVWLFFFGFIGYYLASLFDFMGLQYLTAGLERIILFIYPTIVVLLSWIFFKKKLTKNQFIAIIVTYIGVLVAFWDEIGLKGDDVILGGFFIFLSAVTYASYLVGSGWLIPKFGMMQFTSYAMIVSTIVVCIHFLFQGNYDVFHYPKEVYWLGLAMAIFSTLIPSFLVSAAIERLGASTFSIFGSLGPISTILLAFVFLDERITMLQIVGMCIVIVGVTFISLKKSKG